MYELGTDYLQLLVNDEQLCDEREMEYHKILVDDVIIKDMRKMKSDKCGYNNDCRDMYYNWTF